MKSDSVPEGWQMTSRSEATLSTATGTRSCGFRGLGFKGMSMCLGFGFLGLRVTGYRFEVWGDSGCGALAVGLVQSSILSRFNLHTSFNEPCIIDSPVSPKP